MSLPVISSDKPPASLRDMSFHQAAAGQAAQENAANLGADPHDLRALAASVAPASVVSIRNKPLHGWSLQVILDLQLATTILNGNPLRLLGGFVERVFAEGEQITPTAEELRLVAITGLIFSDPFEALYVLEDARQILEEGSADEACKALAMGCVRHTGDWTPVEIGLLIRHIITLGKSDPTATPTRTP